MHFMCNFDMSKDIAHFSLMPDEVKSSAIGNAFDVIYESFVVTGDQDYATSRLLAQNGLARAFYWAAAQAIEKYLKAILLLNGFSVIEFNNHSIKRLFNAAVQIDSSITELNIQPHQSLEVDPKVSQYLKTFTIQEFLDELDTHGNPYNRYNAEGVNYNTGHLLALDSLSFQLKTLMQIAPLNENFIKLSKDLKIAFERNNPWFNENSKLSIFPIPSEEFPIRNSMSVTKFEILTKHRSNPSYSLALEWLEKKMRLPQKSGNQKPK